jgi:protocatechuate 3,4-dioxygenase beta subunit
MRLALIFAIICYMGAAATAQNLAMEQNIPVPLADDRYAANCSPTPAVSRYPYPSANNIYPSGKMARPAGKGDYAQGQLLYVHGRVFDSACVPLRNAKVELWQTNSSGRYAYAKIGELSNPYPTFTGAGMVHTNNEGEFMFETIFPAPLPNQTPYLNIRVSHDLMKGGLQSVIYFAGDVRNDDDKNYNQLSEVVRQKVTAEIAPYNGKPAKSSYYGSISATQSSADVAAANGEMPKGVIIHHDITVQVRDYFRKF